MNLYYDIAGIHFVCHIPFPVTITEESYSFLIPECDSGFVFQLQPAGALELPASGGIWMSNAYYLADDNGTVTYHCSIRGNSPYSRVSWRGESPGKLLCEYIPGEESQMCYTKNLIDLLELESFLLRYDGLLLHSAFIRSRGRGILFTAPSGTGKSTQASLWEAHMGAEILNGDRAGLRMQDGQWTAWGLPYAGSSGIYRNDSAPVTAIVVLRQAVKNKVSRMTPAKALPLIYPELTIHRWDAGFARKAVDLLLNLLASVPVYLLECLPDRGAVLTLEEQLNERSD